MLKKALTEKRSAWLDKEQAILPIMTALFVDGLGPVENRAIRSTDWFGTNRSKKGIHIFSMPIPAVPPPSLPEIVAPAGESSEGEAIPGLPSGTSVNRQGAVRSLIRGISHHFNNLLMGIWGNATLIRMQLADDDPLYTRMAQMERLIQSGAFLIHMVLGYLGERRTIAKRIRLNQLIMEIKNEIQDCDGEKEDPWNFEARLKWASRVQRPRMIASSTARVLEVLFQGIGAHCRDIVVRKAGEKDISNKMENIATLVARGLQITHQLRLYAGDVKSSMARIQPDLLVRRLTEAIRKRHRGIRVTCAISDNLPMIRGDRRQLEHALGELIANAVAAVSAQGDLAISVRTLYPRALKNRCADQYRRDYVVISIQDSGCGICQKIQKRMFEPFFAFPAKHGKKGLGLAAVDGILATHNGYVQVQSEKGTGSTITLYLPAGME